MGAPTASKTKAAVDWFLSGLEKGEVETILAAANTRRFQAQQPICRIGEPAKHLFLIQKGRVRYHKTTHDGREITLGYLVPGEVFGLVTLLANPVDYFGTAESTEDSEILVWERAAVHRLASLHPRLFENSLRIALHYVALFVDRHMNVMASSAKQRLARTLSRVASRSGRMTPAGVEIDIKNEHLASLADISFFTTSRFLKEWERQGATKKTRGKILIQCPEKLVAE